MNSSESVGWPAYVQERLFQRLCAILEYTDTKAPFTLLDIGCGLGDLYAFLLKNGYSSVIYTGIDILPEMVRFARKKYPGASFHTADFINKNFENTFDFAVCSGSMNIFNGNSGHGESVKLWIRKMYSICRLGSAFNLLSSHGRDCLTEDRRLYYADPGEIMSFCREFCTRAECDHSDFAYAFTVFCPKSNHCDMRREAFYL